jgi:GNAT superfamily N-acetyltransferase
VNVRELQAHELPQILALYEHLHRSDEPPPAPASAAAVWAEAMSNPRCRYFGGFEGKELLSSCTIMVIPNLTRGCRPYALIENVVTHRQHRNKGWGTAVLHQALGFAWEQGCYKVMLLTGSMEESVFQFYEGAGFSRHGKQAFVARREA